MYDPEKLKNNYDAMAHGKAKIAAMRNAIEEADANEDRPYQFYFREDLCSESTFYGDELDLLVIFPELLALADRYPDTPTTKFDSYYNDAVDHILWVYKWVLSACEVYYQIPMEDCLKFFEDFKQRCIAYGYTLRPYYNLKYNFYCPIDEKKAEEAFHAFERTPRDSNSDCKACERNTAIEFYLDKGNMKRAEQLSQDIENRTLCCGSDKTTAWLRMKGYYLRHYMSEGNLEEALKYCKLLERYRGDRTEHQRWDDYICCYAHTDIGKALKLYKDHWKELQENRKPFHIFWTGFHLSHFFEKLAEERKGDTVKLSLDPSFPLYREDGRYKIRDLRDYYYQSADAVAKKLDARNGTEHYQDIMKKGILF